MSIKMIATKRFRLAQSHGFVWIDPGRAYTVESARTAEVHEKSGRGQRAVTPKPQKGDEK